jgi:hypothetical protein
MPLAIFNPPPFSHGLQAKCTTRKRLLHKGKARFLTPVCAKEYGGASAFYITLLSKRRCRVVTGAHAREPAALVDKAQPAIRVSRKIRST